MMEVTTPFRLLSFLLMVLSTTTTGTTTATTTLAFAPPVRNSWYRSTQTADTRLDRRQDHHHQQHRQWRQGFSVTRQNNSNLDNEQEDQTGQSSVGDYVRGVHGGKYQFDTVGGMTFEGQQFAEALYSGSSDGDSEEDFTNEPLPKWAERLRDTMVPPSAACPLELRIGNKVTVVNEERSWERFYAFVVPSDVLGIRVEPWVGQLAPRGGANGFSDTATLSVERDTNEEGSGSSRLGIEPYLVVGTEAEKWIYKLL